MKFNYQFIFALIILSLFGCENTSNEILHETSYQAASITDQKAMAFVKKIKSDLNSTAQEQIPPTIGNIQLDYTAYFETNFDEQIGVIPIFNDNSDRTEGIILAITTGDRNTYLLFVRGQLYKYDWNQSNTNSPNPYVIANLFVINDRFIFEDYENRFSEIIGKKKSTSSKAKTIDALEANTRIKYGYWTENYECFPDEISVNGGEVYYNWDNATCNSTGWVYVGTDAGAPILIDEGAGGGGGGGSYVSAMCNYYGQLDLDCDAMNAFEQDYRTKMSAAELKIFNELTNWRKARYLANAQHSLNKAAALYPYSTYNGKGDAFRHALFSALNASSIGATLAESLQTAHEQGPADPTNPYRNKETQMDLFNNAVGRSLGNLPGYVYLEGQVQAAINDGRLKYLNHLDPQSQKPTANSQLIPTDQ